MPDHILTLQRLAFQVGRQLAPHDTPVELILRLGSGRVVRLPVDEGGEGTKAFEPEARPGWDFSRKVPRYYGVDYPTIMGRPLAVLRLLAAADGPLGVEDLRAAWADYKPEEKSVRNMVGELKKALRALWPDWEGEVITGTGTGYRLEIR